MGITTNEKKIELIEKLVNDKHINFREALLLLETEINTEYIFSRYYPSYPFYDYHKITCDDDTGNFYFQPEPSTSVYHFHGDEILSYTSN